MSYSRPRFNLVGRKSKSTGPYCGAKSPAPDGRAMGTPNVCFRKGIAVGAIMGEQKGLSTGRQQGMKKVNVSREAASKRSKPPHPVAAQAAETARATAGTRRREIGIKELAEMPVADFNALAVRNGFANAQGRSTITSGSRMDKARKLYNKIHP